ncbi:pseudouridine synthase [Endozoicomonas arenosclerae]|uniref:pseudouridine synthase n=1 Tax=Endozoicomonas arenosclerae TaxID=1633495 RepID=UPI0009A1D928|nr:pseudouridine synthase [Endozoicomonas arenosclerae]
MHGYATFKEAFSPLECCSSFTHDKNTVPANSPTRLSKWIADSGYCSRRAACRLIEAGEVEVNGEKGKHTDRVSETDSIIVEQTRITAPPKPVYLLYNKPVGIDCVCNKNDPDSIIHQLNQGPRVFPVGRLDKDSHGLLMLTNDGELCQKILHPDYFHEKEYKVTVNKVIDNDFCSQMSKGVEYDDVKTRPCKITPISPDTFHIIITQGMNRQIRRMCQSLGYHVTSLKRIRLVNLELNDLLEGTFRTIDQTELNTLRATLLPS